MFQVASSVKPLLHSNIPTKDIPRNQRYIPKISGRPNRRFFSSLGYCVRISHRWRALFQNGQISLLWYGVVNRILPFKRHFFAFCGIALKHSMDTTRHVLCSRSIGISFERVCFRLHPESSLCYLENIPKPKDIPRNQLGVTI